MLRDVQRLAGVSNSAAYRHYSDRHALLAAVTEVAQNRLADTMAAAIGACLRTGPRPPGPCPITSHGQAYVDFALAEPGLFRTAFAFDPLAGPEPRRIPPAR